MRNDGSMTCRSLCAWSKLRGRVTWFALRLHEFAS